MNTINALRLLICLNVVYSFNNITLYLIFSLTQFNNKYYSFHIQKYNAQARLQVRASHSCGIPSRLIKIVVAVTCALPKQQNFALCLLMWLQPSLTSRLAAAESEITSVNYQRLVGERKGASESAAALHTSLRRLSIYYAICVGPNCHNYSTMHVDQKAQAVEEGAGVWAAHIYI